MEFFLENNTFKKLITKTIIMKTLTSTIGRVLFAVPFGIFGIMHIMFYDAMAGMVPEYIPGGGIWVYITGMALLGACIAIITKKMAKIACMLLALLLLVFILTMHVPGLMSADDGQMQMSMINLLKDMALMGSAVTYIGLLGEN